MFIIFALLTLTGAVALAFQRNLVVAGLCLVLSFMGVAGLFLLLLPLLLLPRFLLPLFLPLAPDCCYGAPPRQR